MPTYHQAATPLFGRNDSEDGPSAKRLHHVIGPTGTCAILGFACDAGVQRNHGRVGARQAPEAIRQSLATLAAPAKMPNIADLGDVMVDGDDLEAGQTLLAEHVSKAVGQYTRTVVLGGGHETAFGSFSGLREARPDQSIGIINLDAHLDIRTPASTGASSGTPFFQIHALDPDRFDYLCIGVAQESNTQALFERAAEWHIDIVSDHALLEDSSTADDVINEMARRCDTIYLTIDMDVLPHYQAAGVSAPAARGVPLQTIERLIDVVASACRKHDCTLPLADIVEVCPALDPTGVTARIAAILALRLLTAEG